MVLFDALTAVILAAAVVLALTRPRRARRAGGGRRRRIQDNARQAARMDAAIRKAIR